MNPKRRERIFILNDPHALRVSAALAVEIGLNESMILLQLEFLISISDNVHEGRTWTYQSLAELKEQYFPFWSRPTIMRAIKELERRQLIVIGNFNRAGFDKTQWYALDYEGLALLDSIRIATTLFQSETPVLHPVPSVFQSETTIPETTSETPPQREDFEDSKGLRLVEKYDDARVALLPYVTDLARELNDQAPLASTVTRVVNTFRQSGLDIDSFVDRMMTARGITQKRTSSIRTTSTGLGAKPKVQYFLAVLEDLVSDTSATGTADE